MGADEDPSSILPGCSGINQSTTSSSSSGGTTHTSYIHKSKQHDRYLLNELAALRVDEHLCDVVLLAGHGRIAAHRVVLSACSLYFRAMFISDLKESRLTEIRMVDIEGRTLQQLINFCYTGEIKITETSVQYLLPAACLLQMSEVQDACCEFLEKNLDPSNCLGIRAFADTHSCRELVRTADLYTQKNFQVVTASDEFLQLALDQLLSLISSDELNVGSEEQVYEAAIRWIRYDLPNRRLHLSKVLEHVRLPLCNPKFLVSIVSEDALVKADSAARDLVDEAKNYLLLPLERVNMQGPRTRPRKPANHGEVLYAVGGWCSGDAIATVERMDPSRTNPTWEQVLPMKKRRCGVGVAVMDGLLYAVGGHDGNSYLNSVERYDPATNQWDNNVAPTTTSRTSVGVAVLDGSLYAVGGQDGVSCLDLVERYDSKRNEWCRVAAMSTRRLGVSVAVLKGCLYAVGGSDGQNPLNTVEKYDPRFNKWSLVKPMNIPRKHLGTAVYDGKLYAVGGRDDKSELSSVECYDPSTNEWRFIVAMQNRRSGVGLAVVNDQLFAVGGFDGASYMKSVEVYDPELNAWKQHSNMNYRRLGGGVGAIKITGNNTGHIIENPTLRIERKNKGIQDYATDEVVG